MSVRRRRIARRLDTAQRVVPILLARKSEKELKEQKKRISKKKSDKKKEEQKKIAKKKNKKKSKLISLILIIGILLSTFILAEDWGYNILEEPAGIITFTGNLTNLSEMQDVNIPSPNNNEVLTYHSATRKWISQTASVIARWLVDTSNGFLYTNSTTLFFNDTQLNKTIDLRSLNQTEADNIYLRLDTSNDPLTGNLSMNNNNIVDTAKIIFNLTICDNDEVAGTLCHDPEHDTLKYYTIGGQVIQLSQEVSIPMKNKESFMVKDGSYVYESGSSGDNPEFKLAIADNFNTSGMVGVLTIPCEAEEICKVTFFGFVNGIDTSDFSLNDKRYLSATEAGNATIISPGFPNNIIWMDTVVRVNSQNGRTFVFPKLDTSNGMTFNTIGVIGDIIQTDYKIRSLPGNEFIDKNVFCIEMNGSTGNTSCHLTFQSGGAGQASAWERSGMVVPEDENCNNENRTSPQCFANSAGYSLNILDFNTSISEGADWLISGELEVIKDADIQGNLNVSNNITIGDSIHQNDYFIKSKPSNNLINGDIFSINSNATTSVDIPFVGFQSGGPGQGSWIGGSLMLVDRNETILNTINASSCQEQADSHGIELKIDCNSSSPANPLGSGPDFLSFGDIQVAGESWLRNSEGDWRFFTRVLTLLDETYENILFNDLTLSISNGILNLNDTLDQTIVVNINRSETIFTTTSDSIALNTGTNNTPAVNHISYQNPSNPTLTIGSLHPTDVHADVGNIYVGDDTSNIYLFGNSISHNNRFVDSVYDRFGEEGALYISGLSQSVSVDQLNISSGIVRQKLTSQTYSNNLVSNLDGLFYINSTGNFVQCPNNACLTKYSDDTDISNNKYYTLIWGIVPISSTQQRLMVLLQGNPGSGKEYNNVLGAEEDPLSQANFFPSNTDFKEVFIPVARTIHKRTGNNDFVVFSITGELFQDLRGKATVGSGGVPSPPLTEHDLLNNLAWNVSGHEGTGNLEVGLFNITVGDTVITKNLIVNNIALFINSLNNFMGIGTSNPTHKLNVVGDANITENLFVGGDIETEGNIKVGGNITNVDRIVGQNSSYVKFYPNGNVRVVLG